MKLKLEFNILNRLIMAVKARNPGLFHSNGNVDIRLHVIRQTNILSSSAQASKSYPDLKMEEMEEDLDAISPVKSLPDSHLAFAKRDTLNRTKTHNSSRMPIAFSVQSTTKSKDSRELLRINSNCNT